MINKVILIGNTGKDPEMVRFDNGGVLAKVSLATTEKWKDKDGNKQEHTEWHSLVFRNKLSEIVEKYVKKGDKLYIEGKLKTNKKDDKYYTNVEVREMTMLGSGSGGSSQSSPAEASDVQPDDLPF